MELWKIEPGKVAALLAPGAGLPDEGFAWLDIPHYFLGAAAGYGVLRLLRPAGIPEA